MLSARADTLTVNTATDNESNGCAANNCTLREAIADANPGDTITSSLTYPATITLTGGELVINKNLTITGPGADRLTISGNDTSRVFNVSNSSVTISGLTIRDGYVTGKPANGGVISVASGAALTLQQVTVTDNLAQGSSGGGHARGGGIANSGTLTVTNSTLSGNTAQGGNSNEIGGFAFGGGGSDCNSLPDANRMRFTNVTFSGNTAQGGSGGMSNGRGFGGGLSAPAQATQVSFGTIAGKTASEASGGINGSGINNLSVTIKNTSGATILGDTTGNITGSAPNLAALADNGGPTQTHALNAGSTDIDGSPVSAD